MPASGYNYDSGGGQSANFHSPSTTSRLSFTRSSGGPTNLVFWTNGVEAPKSKTTFSSSFVFYEDVVAGGQTLAVPTATETDSTLAFSRFKVKAVPVGSEADSALAVARGKRKAVPFGTVYDESSFASLARWQVVYGPYGGTTYAANAGRLEATLPSGSGFRAVQIAFDPTLNLLGASARAQVSLVGSPVVEGIVVAPEGDRPGFNAALYFSTESFGYYDGLAFADTPYVPTGNPFLRIRESGGTIYFENAASAGGPYSVVGVESTSVFPYLGSCAFSFYSHVNSSTASPSLTWMDDLSIASNNSESDLVVALPRRKSRAVTTVTETNAAQALGKTKMRAVAFVTETDAAIAIVRSSGIMQAVPTAVEADTTLTFARRKARTLTVAQEAATALGLARGKLRGVSTVTEADSAQGFGRAKTRALSLVSEADTALSLGRRKARTVTTVSETDSALSFASKKVKAVALAAEVNTALAVARRKARALGVVSEADTTLTFGRKKSKVVSTVGEVDLALVIARPGQIILAVPMAVEADSAVTFGRLKRKAVPVVSEANTTLTFTRRKGRTLTSALETNTAQGFARAKRKGVTTAVEFDTVLTILVRLGITLAVPTAVEQDFAIAIVGRTNYDPLHGMTPDKTRANWAAFMEYAAHRLGTPGSS